MLAHVGLHSTRYHNMDHDLIALCRRFKQSLDPDGSMAKRLGIQPRPVPEPRATSVLAQGKHRPRKPKVSTAQMELIGAGAPLKNE